MNAKEHARSGVRWMAWLGLAVIVLAPAHQCFALAPKVIQFESPKDAAAKAPAVALVGAVESPGTYKFTSESIPLKDLIARAGGLLDSAGRKIQIVRGGRAGVVLLYTPEIDYKLRPGDVVIIEQSAPGRARTVSFSNSTKSDSVSVVRSQQQKTANADAHQGHVVLIGLQPHPVVMPLWESGLTVDSLLTYWLKQPARVAAGTVVVAGDRSRTEPGLLSSGMVLSVPPRLVSTDDLPRLPSVLDFATAESTPPAVTNEPLKRPTTPFNSVPGWSQESSAEQTPRDVSSDLAPVPPLQSMNETATPAAAVEAKPQRSFFQSSVTASSATESSVPGLSVPSALPNPTAEPAPAADMTHREEESNPRVAALMIPGTEDTVTDASGRDLFEEFQSAAPDSYTVTRNDGVPSERGEIHMAAAGEVVPNPLEPPASSTASLIGFVAGAIVVIGVVTVIFASIRAHLNQRGLSEEIPQPVREKPVRRAAPVQEAVAATEQSTGVDERTPVIEERVLLPREMKFFGKPHLQYEFRIDAAHEVPRPHISTGARAERESRSAGPHFRRSVTKDDVQWQGQTGLCESEYSLFQQSTSSNS
ncbi:SLBB domain-containing protein [Rubinisphaera margarita]|uniref:SLBB domain-containing protein n=1 Tax=Rubinisphaera margarita TaxID=2909586 RepID=UPI001EE7C902|nr:SLBB domain-containing protein [Rubinisphaera margarita]MCG6157387.1 SLBB domain-containing protein [Rubinisphaera margarita]